MSDVLKYEEQDFEPIEAGLYEATFKKYEKDEMANGPVYRMTFEIINDEDSAGHEITAIASQKFNPKSKLFAWVTGMLGRPPEPSERIVLSDLVGTECVITVGHVQKDRSGVTVTYENIDAVNPKRRPKKREKENASVSRDNAVTGADIEDELENAPF